MVDGFFNTEMHREVHTEMHRDNANINGGCSFYVSYIVLPLNWYFESVAKKETHNHDRQLQMTPDKTSPKISYFCQASMKNERGEHQPS